ALAVWGGLAAQATAVASGRCRALQDGELHCHTLAAGTRACAALSTGSTGYVCMPVLAQGGTLGLLHLQFDTHDVREHEAVARLARELAERLGLTLANLELRESLRHESLHDPLTGVCNRRYMEDCLRRELVRIARDGHVLSVLMVDIDHFKAVNDRWGHEAGDRTLRATARRLGRGTRGGDVVCRYGGEEFVVILPGADLTDAARRAEQLRAEAESGADAGEEPGAQPVTLSIGVASAPLHGRSSDALLGAADRALYQAKSAGRNRVVIAAEPAA
nr:diguanylate cyclase [Plasticicumulans sp.]